jgi:hypothetical protein
MLERRQQALDKQNAAERAVGLLQPGMVVGLGSGSTARVVIDEIGRRLERRFLSEILGVATSRATERHARACGIPLTTLDVQPEVDLTIDGADEVDRDGGRWRIPAIGWWRRRTVNRDWSACWQPSREFRWSSVTSYCRG